MSSLRALILAVAASAFALGFVSVGIRWHVYRAHASLYARQEMEHTFDGAELARAARIPGAPAGYRKLAAMHAKAALECARLREYYETRW